jgi:hypothetical protein
MDDLPAAFAAIIAFLFIPTQEKDNPAIGGERSRTGSDNGRSHETYD